MRILFVADLHYSLKQFDWLVGNAEYFDAVIIGGDLLDLASRLEIDVQIVVVEKYLSRLRQICPTLVCSGNHDGDHHDASGESVAGWLQEAKDSQLIVDGSSIELGGTLFTICPWWDGPNSRAQVEKQLLEDSLRSASNWVWVHHAPPDGSPVSWTGKQFAGDAHLVRWIERFKPALVLSGHIHNSPFLAGGSWIDQVGDTWVFNPGRQPGPHPTLITLDLDEMRADWFSAEEKESRSLRPESGTD